MYIKFVKLVLWILNQQWTWFEVSKQDLDKESDIDRAPNISNVRSNVA